MKTFEMYSFGRAEYRQTHVLIGRAWLLVYKTQDDKAIVGAGSTQEEAKHNFEKQLSQTRLGMP